MANLGNTEGKYFEEINDFFVKNHLGDFGLELDAEDDLIIYSWDIEEWLGEIATGESFEFVISKSERYLQRVKVDSSKMNRTTVLQRYIVDTLESIAYVLSGAMLKPFEGGL